MSQYRLDRTSFWAGKLEDQDRRDAKYWANRTVDERMRASWYMTCRAYGYDPEDPPRLDRTVFFAEKRFS